MSRLFEVEMVIRTTVVADCPRDAILSAGKEVDRALVASRERMDDEGVCYEKGDIFRFEVTKSDGEVGDA